MPVGAARGVRLSGARAPHGGRTLAAVAVRGHGSSLSPPHHCTGGRLGRPSPLPSCCRGRTRGLGSWVDRAACWLVSDGGGA